MARNSVKLLLAALLAFTGFVPAQAQNAYPLFEPADGILVGDQDTYVTTAADASDIISLWTSCSITTFLRGDGSCSLVNMASNVTGTLPVGNGGTGVTSLGNLTRVDDSNVTLTLGGTPTGALINSTSLTLGWTGLLPASRGGLGISTVTDDTVPIANGTAWVSSALPNCLDTSGNHLNYNPSTNSIFCGTSSSVSPVSPANPTATIGLTAVNGTSPNFIRSDGAPALSQGIQPTWTAQHRFQGTLLSDSYLSMNGISLSNSSGTEPVIWFRRNAGAADAKNWAMFANPTSFDLLTYDDAGTNQRTAFSATRSGNTVTNVAFGNATNNPTYSFLGTGTATFNGLVALTGSAAQRMTINSTAAAGPYVTLQRSGVSVADIGTGTNCGGSFTPDSLCLTARAGNPIQLSANGSGSPHVTLDTSGNLNGTANMTATRFLTGSGTAANPGFSFTGENNSGLYRDGTTGRINFSGNGSQTGYIDNTLLYVGGNGVFEGRNFTAGGTNSSSTAVQLCHSSSGYATININVVCTSGGGYNYGVTDVAGQIDFSNVNGVRAWTFKSTASGTGGTAITWTEQMTLNSAGTLTVQGDLVGDTVQALSGASRFGGSASSIRTRALDTVGDTYISFQDSTDVEKGYLGYGGSADDNMYLVNGENADLRFWTNNTSRLLIDAGGGIYTQGVTGGSQGAGTINAGGLYVNGVAVTTGGGGTKAFKSSATDRSSTTTLASDPDLVFTAAASASYRVNFCLLFGGATTGTQGFKFAFNRTTAGSNNGSWGGHSRVNGNTVTMQGAVAGFGTGDTTGQVSFATIGVIGTYDQVCGNGIIDASSGVSYAIQWAQNSSNANATRLQAGSFLIYERIN